MCNSGKCKRSFSDRKWVWGCWGLRGTHRGTREPMVGEGYCINLLGCCNKALETGWLKQQKYIFCPCG